MRDRHTFTIDDAAVAIGDAEWLWHCDIEVVIELHVERYRATSESVYGTIESVFDFDYGAVLKPNGLPIAQDVVARAGNELLTIDGLLITSDKHDRRAEFVAMDATKTVSCESR